MIKEVITQLFGQYVPIFYTVGDDMIIPAGASGVDWTFIAGVLLFALTLYCVFRIVGVLLND